MLTQKRREKSPAPRSPWSSHWSEVPGLSRCSDCAGVHWGFAPFLAGRKLLKVLYCFLWLSINPGGCDTWWAPWGGSEVTPSPGPRLRGASLPAGRCAPCFGQRLPPSQLGCPLHPAQSLSASLPLNSLVCLLVHLYVSEGSVGLLSCLERAEAGTPEPFGHRLPTLRAPGRHL